MERGMKSHLINEKFDTKTCTHWSWEGGESIELRAPPPPLRATGFILPGIAWTRSRNQLTLATTGTGSPIRQPTDAWTACEYTGLKLLDEYRPHRLSKTISDKFIIGEMVRLALESPRVRPLKEAQRITPSLLMKTKEDVRLHFIMSSDMPRYHRVSV